jgi:succinoglycan biosynthesis transport protein ExoP
MTDNPLTINNKTELEKFSFSDAQAAIIDSQDDQISIVQFWRVLQKRRWLVLGSLAAVVLLVTAVSLFLPKRYEASSRLLLDLEGADDLGLEQMVMPIGLDMNTKLETQIRIVQSDTIATSVIKQLGLHRNKGFAGKLYD